MIFTTLAENVTLKTDEDLRQNPFAAASIIVVGSLDGLGLDSLITQATGSMARVQERTWQAVNEDIEDEQIATVRWICESCIVIGLEETAVTQRNGENVCQDCAEDIDDREEHPR